MKYKFSNRSLNNLKEVHPDLVACVVLSLYVFSDIDFAVIEGSRTIERQRVLFNSGNSKTMNSKHLIQSDGFSHAVDLVPWVNGTIPWDDWNAFKRVSNAMNRSSKYLDIDIIWGGDWKNFKDGPHFQL